MVAVLALAGTFAPATFAPASFATAAPTDGITVVDGTTAIAYDYADAVRERIFIPVADVDQDLDGVDDVTVIDIMRPRTADPELRFAAIIEPSPYFTTSGRGNEAMRIADLDSDGINDVWPLYYDNYFVPRGYAVILAHANGTGLSTGCDMHGGVGDIESMKVVIDWLNGRVPGYDADDNPVSAGWHNGHAAMIGKSYDGTLANGVAATGVEGLTTIVPIAAISDWYNYSRWGGIRTFGFNYPSDLSNAVTNDNRRVLCQPVRSALSAAADDASGDINDFWAERNYLHGAGNITASVFAVHGLNDDNVKMNQLGPYWDALTTHDVPRKIWLAKVGHVDPFDFRRAEWVDTLHRWFDHWLYQLPNGVMDEPMATVETDPGVFVDYASWPVPGTEDVRLSLTRTEGSAAGALRLRPEASAASLAFTGIGNRSDINLTQNPDTAVDHRVVFMSEPLTAPLHLSGTPTVELTAALDAARSNLSAFVVDYAPMTRTPRTPWEGVQNTTARTCWGESSVHDDACFLEVVLRSTTVDQWRVSRGVLDSSNRESLIHGEAVDAVPGEQYEFTWDLDPYDHTFPAGHRIGVVIAGNHMGASSPLGTTVTIDTLVSGIQLPLTGGVDAAYASGAFGSPPPVALTFDLGGHGAAMPAQSVEYGASPDMPPVPAEEGWVFQGWFADTARTVPFDFDAELRADAVGYALWADIADVAVTLELHPSATSVDEGDTITVLVDGFDVNGDPLGDVTDFVKLSSDVVTDVVDGNRVAFPTASEHTITATLGSATASVVIWVEPTAVPPEDASPADNSALPVSGAEIDPTPFLAGFALMGAGLLLLTANAAARQRSTARRAP